jgi:hypothetical protein
MAYVLFLDESGQDHHESPYAVLGGIAVEDSRIWALITNLREAELEHFGCRLTSATAEFKAKKLLKRKVFKHATQMLPIEAKERSRLAREALEEGRAARAEDRKATHTRHQLTGLAQAKLAFCMRVFELCALHQVRAFASIVDPAAPQPKSAVLRKDYSYLFERFFAYLEDVSQSGRDHGIVVFDELEKSQSHVLIRQMAEYFQNTATGRLRASRVLPEPMFVHSELTTLIQVADLLVYIISWAVRVPGMGGRTRSELADLAGAVRTIRFVRRRNQEHPHDLWGFVFIDDLRPRSERGEASK